MQKIVAERAVALLEAKLRGLDRMRNERIQRFIPLAKQLAGNDDESSIVAMLLDEYYQEILHAPVPAVEGKREYDKSKEQKGQKGHRRRPGTKRRNQISSSQL